MQPKSYHDLLQCRMNSKDKYEGHFEGLVNIATHDLMKLANDVW